VPETSFFFFYALSKKKCMAEPPSLQNRGLLLRLSGFDSQEELRLEKVNLVSNPASWGQDV
jgi:hypothetical protein